MPAAALDYTISGNWVFGGATGSQGGFGGTLGRFAVNTVDGIVDQFGETQSQPQLVGPRRLPALLDPAAALGLCGRLLERRVSEREHPVRRRRDPGLS